MCSRTEATRLFFALFPPARLRSSMAELQSKLDFHARPVPAEQFHVTLAFLGEQPAAQLGELEDLAGTIEMSACSLRLNYVGSFSRSQVAYLGASEPPEGLRSFRQELVGILGAAGFALDDRPWRPHVTLYRKMRKPCARILVEPMDWPIRSFCLVSSRLEKSGPVYRVLKRWRSVR